MPPATTLNYTRKQYDVQLMGNPHRCVALRWALRRWYDE